ncbi:TadE/TadG family type IV pilus assembly protein [Caballeronia sp. 15711]|uniref:TadE/TadG family type IV pilus assembly protein n=1 Tax=Caballeronia sp. 15711 TaxID=3391029 RepID=UPI0039E4DBA7
MRKLLRSDRGSVAVELVIIIPLMVLLMVGFSEIYMYMRAVSALEHTAFTLADSLGQTTQIINTTATTDSNDLGSIWNAAALLSAPNSLNQGGGVIITSVCETTSSCTSPLNHSNTMAVGVPEIWWQASAPWNGSGMTTRVTPGAIVPSTWPFRNGDSAIIVEVFYTFNPFAMTAGLWPGAPGTQTLYERIYVRPRTPQPLTLVTG